MPRLRPGSEGRTSNLYDPANDQYTDNRDGTLIDHDDVAQHIPLYGDGAKARIAAEEARREEYRNRAYWEGLAEHMPGADDLAVNYATEDEIAGGPSEWNRGMDNRGDEAMNDALSFFRETARGGFSDTDRAMMDENRRRETMTARADREAAMSALEARGMAGSGMDLVSRMSADEAAASRNASSNVSMLAAAQQRQSDAMRSLAETGSAASGAARDAWSRRASGLDAWNARETDYRRGLEGRNTGHENASRESRSRANQQEYDNRERAVAGVTNQYSTDSSRRNAEADRAQQSDDETAGLIAGLMTSA